MKPGYAKLVRYTESGIEHSVRGPKFKVLIV